MKSLVPILILSCLLCINRQVSVAGVNDIGSWKAGVARVAITPDGPMWMAGYANRDHAAEGKLQELWAKALVLQDGNGKQCVLITLDVCGIPKDLSDRIRDQLKIKNNLSRAQVNINCSHTHSGPVIQNALSFIYPLDDEQAEKVKRYTAKLETQIITLVGNAFKSLVPVDVFTENGLARFQVNRRNNNEPYLLLQKELRGPNDYAVPVIKVADKSGNILAIAFGYACHNTVLNGYQWSGDYAGFAQTELEKMYPDATALFFQGAGADQNPLPRRTVPLAKQYGKELAYAVEKVLSEPMLKQSPNLAMAYTEVQLPLNAPPSREELETMVKNSVPYKQQSVSYILNKMKKGEKLISSYPYPVLVWKLGDQLVVALGGEVVVHYSIEIKKMFGPQTFVMGYSNDVMAYIPSVTILRESNDKTDGYAFYDPVNKASIAYEGGLDTQMLFGLPATWASSIETVIFSGVQNTAKKAGVSLMEYK
ncbi:MAG: neutral/alkaline non-lysosomal ceramidase N-terminal domain-containing protein [Bacteroidetes bacterium]|nr:neutral/alkaline non-lysosomal ceramidase N-terminal domain-containing protein [Bacteroidota bacterium]